MMERYVADADPRNILKLPTGGGYLRSDPISTIIFSVVTSRSARGIAVATEVLVEEHSTIMGEQLRSFCRCICYACV